MRSTNRSSTAARALPLAVLLATSLSLPGIAAAAEDLPQPDLSADGLPATNGAANMRPAATAARVSGDRLTATTWAGYDGGTRVPLLTATAEARIVGRVVFVAGAGFIADAAGSPAARPQIGLRAQLLDQASHGVDGGAAVMYRQDLFASEEGFIQGAIALERRQGRVRIVGDLLYGQDGEGDDRDGEAHLAALVAARPGLLVGVDGRYRHALWSSDPNRTARARPAYELLAGPSVSYAHGSLAVMGETGVSTVGTTSTRTGVVALVGIGSTF
ncbi:MAG TPA: hypothetical protein VKQ32_27240 [Polyangia bacterium]|nr:hypothetical protein [Polyangia bacterium]